MKKFYKLVVYLYNTLIVRNCMWSFIVFGGFRRYRYIFNGYRSAKYFIARWVCPLHAIRRYQVLNSLHIINNNNNHENVKYAATNIVNKMTIVEDLNGFGKKSFTNFLLYMCPSFGICLEECDQFTVSYSLPPYKIK
jgi:hypothetical protein